MNDDKVNRWFWVTFVRMLLIGMAMGLFEEFHDNGFAGGLAIAFIIIAVDLTFLYHRT